MFYGHIVKMQLKKVIDVKIINKKHSRQKKGEIK